MSILEKKKSKILVTGGAGMIGSHLLRRLVDNGLKPTIFIRRNTNLSRIQNIMHKLKIEVVDLLDREVLFEKTKLYKPNLIFHLAGSYLNPPDFSIIDHFETNLKGTINLLEAIKDLKDVRFIYTGSQAQYQKSNSICENSPSTPDSIYGVSKQGASLISSVLCKEYDIEFIEIRLFTPFGEWEKKTRLIPYVVNSILENEEIIIRTKYAQADYIYISDVIDALMIISKLCYNSEIKINICSGRFIKVNEIVEEILRIMNKKANIMFLDTTVFDNSRKTASNLFAKEKLNWFPKVSFDQGLKNTVKWIVKNRDFYKY